MSQAESVEDGPKGFGGWLILPMIGLIISPFTMGFQFFNDLLPALNADVWRKLTDASLPGHRPMLAPLIIFEVVANVAMFAFTLVVAWFFFNKSRRTPRLYVIWMALLAATQIIDAIMVSSVGLPVAGSSGRDIIRSVIAGAIWIPYFLVSKRVKNTFVEPRSDVAHHF
jgi:hypothetical protein